MGTSTGSFDALEQKYDIHAIAAAASRQQLEYEYGKGLVLFQLK